MAYSESTFKDPNPIKRWLQFRRLATALQLAGSESRANVVCDFGAGNGELCKLLSVRTKAAEIICYEPAAVFLAEARENLEGVPRIQFTSSTEHLSSRSVDVLFCLEVLEHLQPNDLSVAIDEMARLLTEQGRLVLGVPIEVGLPALYKGAFRMTRRYGEFDANIKNVLAAAMYRPPTERPIHRLDPGVEIYPMHMGFDHRTIVSLLTKRFELIGTTSSPFPLGSALMPERYFVARPKPARKS